MSLLSLSWLGLGPVAASPWLLLLLVGVSWLLARVLAWTYAFYDNRRRLQCFPQPPKRNWFLGHLGLVPPTEQGMRVLTQLVATHPQGFKVWMGPFIPIIRLCHPNIIRSVINASAAIAPKDEVFYKRSIMCKLDGMQGEKRAWRVNLMLIPTLYGGVICSWILCLCSWGFRCVKLLSPFPPLSCRKPSEYIAAILELSALVVKRHQHLLLHTDFLYYLTPDGQRFRRACRLVHDFTDAVIQQRRRTLPSQDVEDFLQAKAKSKTLDFIDVLLLSKDEDGKVLSDEDIRAEAPRDPILSCCPSGHDTTASGLSWVLYHLAKHPEYQERCRQPSEDGAKEIEWDDLAQLPFLTMCVKESLRLHPPVPAVSRCCTQDIALPDGRVIPKGVICLISVFGTHHNPAVWPDPEVYDPFRFDPENVKERSPLAFIPFSAGPRNCIGQAFAMAEMKVVLALTLLRFRVLLDHTEPRRKPELVLRAEGGLWLRVEPRS
uniref:Uncharacterized protein n=1 Tax=Aotus nancymaae TaxID=37293 RepID=A0A2K5E1M4_AOTNA